MENRTMRRTLYKVLRKTGVKKDLIRPEASFKDDLQFDQLDWNLFVYYLEDLFKIRLEDKEISNLFRVNDTLDLLKKRAYVYYS